MLTTTTCRPTVHLFAAPTTPGAFALLCSCNGAILTGATIDGIPYARLEVLGA